MVRSIEVTPMERHEITLVKLLDLLTNRYHVGVLRASGDAALCIDLPASARFSTGQRVRYIIADAAAGLVNRSSMLPACITSILSDGQSHQSIRLHTLN